MYRVYNFEVEETHAYYTSAIRVLSHNSIADNCAVAGHLPAPKEPAGYLPAPKDLGIESSGVVPLPGTRQITQGIPEAWTVRPTKGEGGVWYYDPKNKGNAVRVMQGDPKSPFPNSQVPYVRWQVNGQALDINGKVVPRTTPDAHIPLPCFTFNPSIYK